MKKTLNILYVALAVVAGMYLSLRVMLAFVLPWEPVQRLVLREVSRAAGRPVSARSVSAGLSGLKLTGVSVASSVSPQEGEDALLRADEISLKWSFWKLLTGGVRIHSVLLENLQADVVRGADGTFNFKDLFSFGREKKLPPSKEEKPLDVRLSVQHLRLSGGRFTFTDVSSGQKIEFSDVFLSLNDFDLAQPFSCSVNASLRYERAGFPVQTAELGFTVRPSLNRLELSGAEAKIMRLVLKHRGGVFILNGTIKNLQNPSLDLLLNARNISEKLPASANVQTLPFALQTLTADLTASADVRAETADVKAFSVHTLGSSVFSSGTVSWGKRPSFNVNGTFDVDLAAVGEALEMLRPYRLKGKVSGSASAAENSLQADISVSGAGAALPGAGTLSGFQTAVNIPDGNHLNIPLFSGELNGGKFEGNVQVRRREEAIDVDLKARSSRVALPPSKENSAPAVSSAQSSSGPEQKDAWPLPAVNLKALVEVESLDAPYLYGNGIRFVADMQELTPALNRAQGKLSLNAGEGEIKDLNKLTSANALTKVMFGSLAVVSKVINSLNVFAVLNGIGTGMVEAVSPKEEKKADMIVQTVKDENGNDVQILVPYDAKKVDGILAFEEFSTDVLFKDGVAEVKKGSFVSDLISFNLRGEMNFRTQGLDMTVKAAPGRHYTDGIMPLTIGISGTMDDPKGSLSMAGSISSMLTQSVTNNFASRTVKKGLSGLIGLFKKKKPQLSQTEQTSAPTPKNAPNAEAFAAGAEQSSASSAQ